MLCVVRHAHWVAMPPVGKDLKDLGKLPIVIAHKRAIDAGLFHDLSPGCLNWCLAFAVEAARDGLPEARMIGPLHEQHPTSAVVDDDQD